jgi:hypothetical protein
LSAAVVTVPAEPGLYPGLSFVDYWKIQAVNHSTLEGFRRTPAHAREAMLHPADSTQALALGHAFHTFTLEPARFADEYAVVPKVDRRFKEGKARWAAFEAENKGRLLLTEEEFESYNLMRESILAHPTAAELLSGKGANELTIVWLDKATGLLCKARLDRVSDIGGYSFIGDLKTTIDASERAFSKSVSNYGYHRQGAWYREGLATLRPALRRVADIAVEKSAPYCVAVHELDERALEQGVRENRAFLETFQRCMETGSWPGYPGGMSVIDVPVWAMDGRD